jgi:hypothetical protein
MKQLKQLLRYGGLLVLLGLLVIVIGLWVGEQFRITGHYGAVALKLLDEIGIALFLAGSVGILLELPDWRDYFQREIAKILVDQAYLKKMDNEQLIALQTSTLKAFFKTEDIDRRDSLLQYYYSRIHQHIGSPYREAARDVINIRYRNGGKEIEVEETISYHCRKVGDKIQEKVRWVEAGSAQIKQIKLLDHWVEIRVPEDIFKNPNFSRTHRNVKHENRAIRSAEIPLLDGDGKIGFELFLTDYEGIDGLQVRNHVKYVMPVTMPFTWAMSHPTKGIMAIVNYPPDLELITSLFGLTEDQVTADHIAGSYRAEYESWLLPDTGFAFQLMRKAVVASADAAERSPLHGVAPKEAADKNPADAEPTARPATA